MPHQDAIKLYDGISDKMMKQLEGHYAAQELKRNSNPLNKLKAQAKGIVGKAMRQMTAKGQPAPSSDETKIQSPKSQTSRSWGRS